MTPLFKKLKTKNQLNILSVNSPLSFESELDGMSSIAKIYKDESQLKEIDFAIIFVTSRSEINDFTGRIIPKLKGDAVLWFCYPKGTSKKYSCDFNRDTGWDEPGKHNLEGVRQVAIDEDWSALRFRKTEYIKQMICRPGFAISE